ncbi:hypothetical protein [Nocardia sp. NPDC057440]|uniref:hypothetical protein n=1 Tax=Nocardia sp. NPDC057440 TaxID=3346134 RepID=UPI00366F6534
MVAGVAILIFEILGGGAEIGTHGCDVMDEVLESRHVPFQARYIRFSEHLAGFVVAPALALAGEGGLQIHQHPCRLFGERVEFVGGIP